MLSDVTADCYSNYMKITVQFNGSFEGLVYSTGYAHDSDCVYVNGSGHSKYEFSIRLNRCGTLGRPEFEPTSNEVPVINYNVFFTSLLPLIVLSLTIIWIQWLI